MLSRSESIENYAKAMYELEGAEKRVSTNALAQHLNINAASVTGMLKKISKSSPKLVDYEPHQGAILTEEGRALALEMIRHHRLLETFLVEVLGYSWDEVHDEAEKLEHFISEKFEERIAELLNRPNFDPHGDPIPTRDGFMPNRQLEKLVDLEVGQLAVVRRIKKNDPPLLRYLKQIGIELNVEVKVIELNPADNALRVEIQNRTQFEIKESTAQEIYVELA